MLRKIHSADGFPGVEDLLFGRRFRLFDAHAEMHLTGQAGAIIARRARGDLPCHAGWRRVDRPAAADGRASPGFKRPAVLAPWPIVAELPAREHVHGFDDIRYEERGAVGYLHFDFYNGALSPRRNAIDCAALMREPAGGRRESSC